MKDAYIVANAGELQCSAAMLSFQDQEIAMLTPAPEPAASPPSWDALESQADHLRARQPNDAFVDQVLIGAFRVAGDDGNPIRGNLFAAASRELATHLLHSLAPEAQVRACSWFVQAEDTHTVTRAQRARYIAHGGLAPDYVENVLGFVSGDYVKPLTDAMLELNNRTHLKPDTVMKDDGAIRWLAGGIFDALQGLLETADECRSSIIRKLQGQIDQQIVDRMIGEEIGELDELSTHTQVERHDTEDLEVADIGPEEIRFSVGGTVYVTLQYGSGSDLRRGNGASMPDSYPFEATVIARTAEPTKIKKILELKVDTSSFYE